MMGFFYLLWKLCNSDNTSAVVPILKEKLIAYFTPSSKRNHLPSNCPLIAVKSIRWIRKVTLEVNSFNEITSALCMQQNPTCISNVSWCASLGQKTQYVFSPSVSFWSSMSVLSKFLPQSCLPHQAGGGSSPDPSQGCPISDSAVAPIPGVQGRAWPATDGEVLLMVIEGSSHRLSSPDLLAEGQQGTSQPWSCRTHQPPFIWLTALCIGSGTWTWTPLTARSHLTGCQHNRKHPEPAPWVQGGHIPPQTALPHTSETPRHGTPPCLQGLLHARGTHRPHWQGQPLITNGSSSWEDSQEETPAYYPKNQCSFTWCAKSWITQSQDIYFTSVQRWVLGGKSTKLEHLSFQDSGSLSFGLYWTAPF